MKKIFKIFFSFFVGIVLIFGITGCNASQSELQNKLDDLQSQLEEINDRLTENEEQIEQLKVELMEILAGTLYTVQEAYDNGYLTYADLLSIAYYHNGGRIHNKEIISEDYKPSPKTPEILSELTQLKIKSSVAKDYRVNYNMSYAKAEGFTITEYSGTYGNCVAVMMQDEYTGTTGAEWIDTVAGVNIFYNSGKEIQIWRYNQSGNEGINNAFYNQYGTEFVYDKYYGMYDDARIFFVSSDATAIRYVSIGGGIFKYSTLWEIYVFKNSKFYTLKEAYLTGVLSKQSVCEISKVHADYVKLQRKESEEYFNAWYYDTEDIQEVID